MGCEEAAVFGAGSRAAVRQAALGPPPVAGTHPMVNPAHYRKATRYNFDSDASGVSSW